MYLNACAGDLKWVESFYTNACGIFYTNACEMGGLNDDMRNCMLKMYAQVGLETNASKWKNDERHRNVLRRRLKSSSRIRGVARK